MPSKMWEEITYPFPNVNGSTVKFGYGGIISLRNFYNDVITYPRWDSG